MSKLCAAGLIAGLILTGSAASGLGQADDRDEAVITVQISSAEHETQEGYFTLGDSATVMVKPGSELHRFLSRHRGKKVRISLTEAGRPAPSRLER